MGKYWKLPSGGPYTRRHRHLDTQRTTEEALILNSQTRNTDNAIITSLLGKIMKINHPTLTPTDAWNQ